MNQNLVANILSQTLLIVSLLISVRAFYLYLKSHSPRLFILGLAMIIISFTAVASFLGDNFSSIPINLGWFKYTGQTVCFLFILLSMVRNSNGYLRHLIVWHVVASVLLVIF